jgi:hypothetical protein
MSSTTTTTFNAKKAAPQPALYVAQVYYTRKEGGSLYPADIVGVFASKRSAFLAGAAKEAENHLDYRGVNTEFKKEYLAIIRELPSVLNAQDEEVETDDEDKYDKRQPLNKWFDRLTKAREKAFDVPMYEFEVVHQKVITDDEVTAMCEKCFANIENAYVKRGRR